MADRLDLDTVAEDIEDKATMSKRIALGCNCAQGYYWSTPVAESAFTAWHGDNGLLPFITSRKNRKIARCRLDYVRCLALGARKPVYSESYMGKVGHLYVATRNVLSLGVSFCTAQSLPTP